MAFFCTVWVWLLSRLISFTQIRYRRRLPKNTAQLQALFALVNLTMARRRLAAAG